MINGAKFYNQFSLYKNKSAPDMVRSRNVLFFKEIGNLFNQMVNLTTTLKCFNREAK